ncbi:MAG: hypothetical protein II896_05380 [Clostridia bacterium]|nr:hypothetical protein [Clostridia bacterium]
MLQYFTYNKEILGEINVFDRADTCHCLAVYRQQRGLLEVEKLLRNACTLICNQFKHSPVYRNGGDEFVVLPEGEDYDNRADNRMYECKNYLKSLQK